MNGLAKELPRGKKLAADIVLILLGSAIYAVGFDLFMEPNQFAAGGVTGIGMVLVELTGLGTVGLYSILINIPLFLAGFKRIGWTFFFGSLLGMLASSVMIDLFAGLPTLDTEPILAALFGGLLCGGGLGLVFVCGASTGGTDILARLLRVCFRNLSIGRLMLVVDLLISVAAGVVFQDMNKILYCIVALYVSSIAMDSVVYGFDYSRVALIISDRSSEITEAILDKLDRGVTLLDGEGGYTRAKKEVILCAVKKHQLAELKELVTDIDPTAFIILQEAHQVLGDGFERYDKTSI